MKYTIEIETKGTFMPEIFSFDPTIYKPEEITEDDILKITECPGEIAFCFGMDEDFNGVFRLTIKDEVGNIIYEGEGDEAQSNLWDLEYEDEKKIDKPIHDTFDPGFYLVRMYREKWGNHVYEMETDVFDLEKLNFVFMDGFCGLFTDSWTNPLHLTYDGKLLEYNDGDDVCDYGGGPDYIYERDEGGWWNLIKDVEI